MVGSWDDAAGFADVRAKQAAELVDIQYRLARRPEELAGKILSAGKRAGGDWRCGSIDNTPGSSFALRLVGDRAGLWLDHADPAGASGDALELIVRTVGGGDFPSSLEWARRFLGDEAVAPRAMVAPPPSNIANSDDARQAAQAIWLNARDSLAGTPVDAYLFGRGINLSALGRQPRALRFHPALWCKEARRRLPAMVAAIVDGTGVHAATHCTWLAERPDADGVLSWLKADVPTPKKVLGSARDGSIRIFRGRDATGAVARPLAEGIETALSVALACPELPVLCTISLGGMARVALPASIETVILSADHDTTRRRGGRFTRRSWRTVRPAARCAWRCRAVPVPTGTTCCANPLTRGKPHERRDAVDT